MRIAALPGLSPDQYRRHSLHAEERIWVEKNCYVDIWIEVLHGLGLDPIAVLPFTLAIDFEGDQWTFFKPPHDEIRTLYGLDVQELNVWRPLIDHAEEHLAAGKLISTEADAFWLPDTQGTDYRRQHTKTTIVLANLDRAAGRLEYFHNASFYGLDGEDFARLFRIDSAPDPAFLPLFAELVRFDGLRRVPLAELRADSVPLLRRHLARRPAGNPVRRFATRFGGDLPDLQARGIEYYHQWAFSTTRQLGAAFELAACYLRWLRDEPGVELARAIDDFETIARGAKSFILKAARAVNARRPLDSEAMFTELAVAWERGMDAAAAFAERPD